MEFPSAPGEGALRPDPGRRRPGRAVLPGAGAPPSARRSTPTVSARARRAPERSCILHTKLSVRRTRCQPGRRRSGRASWRRRPPQRRPNNAGDGENCAELADWAGGAWNDMPCDVALPYVCELP
ncbi:lectin-like protein [Sorangium sp. So ce117]|uniref:lectin-like protein n=1 Tax=Sorangium sp. So ce117 TaxID=3133277 RepID=UPI003F6021B8